MSVDGQKVSSPRRLFLPFEQPKASGLATTVCAIPTPLESENLPDTSASPLVPMPRARPPDPSRLTTVSVGDWATFPATRSKSFGCPRERIMIVVNDKIWEMTEGIMTAEMGNLKKDSCLPYIVTKLELEGGDI